MNNKIDRWWFLGYVVFLIVTWIGAAYYCGLRGKLSLIVMAPSIWTTKFIIGYISVTKPDHKKETQ